MKRFLATLMVLLLLATPVLAEGFDLESMDDSSLLALKKAVDMEYSSRIDSEPILLQPGKYIVGKDIKAGRWYVRVNTYEPGESAWSVLEVNMADKGGRLIRENLYLGDRSTVIDVFDGYSIEIDYFPLMFCSTEFDEEHIYKYEAPEGTFVPEGRYVVGEHIPAGTYRVAPAFNWETQVSVTRSVDSSSSEVYHVITTPSRADRWGYISLIEGDRVWVYSSGAIFQKETSLNFNFD